MTSDLSLPPMTNPATGASAAVSEVSAPAGNWFSRHRWFTKEPVSYTGYQFFRSAVAAIPYGFGMAFFHHAFGVMSQIGVRMGLTAAGQEKFYGAMKARDPISNMLGGGGAALKTMDVWDVARKSELHVPGVKGIIGRNMARLGNSPLNAALQIGLAFSMFRFTGGIIKGLRDKVMDEKNTAEDTERASKNWWQTVKQMTHVNWRAEATGTFWGALTLGFIGGLVQQTMPYKRIGNEKLTTAIGRVLSHPSKLFQNAMIWAVSYSTFFEIDERIQKDVKLREGTWKGQPNSLINRPDVLAGTPPAKLPDGTLAPAAQQPEQPKHPFFTADPGLPRMVFRRLLPVAVGITGYAIMKRSMYVAGGGQMRAVTDEINTAGKHAGLYLGNAWREGLATSTFGVLWAATDAWGSWYNKFFTKLQHPASHQAATPHQDQKYRELIDRVNAREPSNGRAA